MPSPLTEHPRQADSTGASTPPSSVVVRPFRSQSDYRACLELQRLTWGDQFGECVPPSILQVSQRIGGVAAGAFAADGALLGFVFGLTGVENGRPVHWSDMLAVRPEARDLGIGRRLKEFQRQTLLPLGVEVIYWTYDPLVARNAHLNLNRLGAEVVEYVPDMYGESDSVLHRGLGTDRLIVAWRLAPRAEGARPAPAREAVASAPVDHGETGKPVAPDAPLVRIEIPADIHAVRTESPEQAARWRSSSRSAFARWLGRGYRVVGFDRDVTPPRCFYILAHP